ncbi:hypothetical protein F53441_12845 [Fusarium austroafricanum]|uniref:Xylanolytic transcriptional activator regulatory domain-containing protein n=1 Tax=Fusarium austroafricanum TaxID=2364996 RepID=A0A8H4NM93_9HYPO|nr:hypothetical protein F53441_12845 [Fusarium austroafricanum]
MRSGGDLADSFVHRTALHNTVKTLYAQVQAAMQTSTALVQAGVIISAYEYASGQIDAAYISIAACIRMAQVLGINVAYNNLADSQEQMRRQAMGHWNLWWSTIILERFIFLESSYADRRTPAALYPNTNIPLPSDDKCDDEYIPTSVTLESSITQSSSILSNFGRQAQAIYMLDRCLCETSQFNNYDLETRLSKLQSFDEELQKRLSESMTPVPHEPGLRCDLYISYTKTYYLVQLWYP